MNTQNVHTMNTRKRIDLKLPNIILEKVAQVCNSKSITRTSYIESLIRKDLNYLGIDLDQKDHGTFEDWGWQD